MMKLQVETHSGKQFELEVTSYDPIDMNQQLNNNNVYTVAIGDTIFSRIDIKLIAPVKEVPVVPINPPSEPEQPPVTELPTDIPVEQ